MRILSLTCCRKSGNCLMYVDLILPRTTVLRLYCYAAVLQECKSPSLAGIRHAGQEASAEKENGCSVTSNSMAAPPVNTGTVPTCLIPCTQSTPPIAGAGCIGNNRMKHVNI